MRLVARAVTLALLTLAAPLAAKDKKPVDPDKKICRHETPTGSMMTRSICHTRTEWTAIDAQSARTANEVRDRQGNPYPSER